MGNFYDITGNRYGRLIVIERVNQISKKTTRWLCLCDCGKKIESNKNNLINGHTKSCGCLSRDTKLGRATRTTHGQSRTRLYHIWQSMKQRCCDKNVKEYALYGARGIGICEEWLTFENFYKWASSGYESKLTIDRIDNNGNYEPSNCRWATVADQNRNKRNNHIICIHGEKKCLSDWSRDLNIPKSTIINRLNRGMPCEDALKMPPMRIRHKERS